MSDIPIFGLCTILYNYGKFVINVKQSRLLNKYDIQYHIQTKQRQYTEYIYEHMYIRANKK